jgi:exodeoxyribonuclease V gamma subunit
MAFYLYQHSNLQTLAEKFLRLRREGVYFGNDHGRRFLPADPMQPETIVLQTYGMRIWLTQLAAHFGAVMANANFLYVNNFILEELRRQLGGTADFRPDLFSTEVLTWRILELMERGDESCRELSAYLEQADSEPGLRRFELASRIAATFDQYQVYLPDQLEQWRKTRPHNAQAAWQAEIWRQLLKFQGVPVLSKADALIAFLRRDPEQVLPRSPVAVFGIGSMPPFYFKVLRQLANAADVHFFYQNPCNEYWADHPIPRRRQKGFRLEDPAEMNPLLGAYGLQGQDFFKEIMELEGSWEEPEDEEKQAERSIFPDSLLGHLQADIVKMRTFPPDGEKTLLCEDDHSLFFHNCHTSFRQVEVLHDQLLQLIEQSQQPGRQPLCPDDILVMAPDLNSFVPAIEAVFSQGPLKNFYALSDRSLRRSNQLAEAFLAILELSGSRFECSRVLALLDSDALRQRFNFDDWAVKKLREWVYQSYVCWGIDGADHEKVCAVPFDAFSWRHAINRMMLGIAIAPASEKAGEWRPAQLALPELPPLNLANSAEERELLGNLSEFLEKLFQASEELQAARHMRAWQQSLEALLADFFIVDNQSAADYAAMHQAIRSITEAAETAAFAEEVSFAVIRRLLADAAETPLKTYPFLAGRITFCSLQPMRSVPRRVIVLLGLDDGLFPRVDSVLGFNLIPQAKRRCTRSRQWEDRYLFMEALLAAQEKLLFFYRGQDAQRQKQYPPALPLCELRDYIKDHYCRLDGADLLPKLTRLHPLHPYTPECYGLPNALFSFNPHYFPIAQKLAKNELPEINPFASGLPEAGFQLPTRRQSQVLQLSELISFLQNSSEAFLVQTLGLPGTEWSRRKHSDLEPVELSEPEKIALSRRLAAWQKERPLALPASQDLLRWLQAECALPAGEPGRRAYRDLLERSWLQNDALRQEWAAQQLVYRSLELSAQGEKLLLEGELLLNLEQHSLIDCRFCRQSADKDPLSDRHKIAAWLRWLLARATSPAEYQVKLRLFHSVFDDQSFRLPLEGMQNTVEAAREKLQTLVDAWLSGRQKPLPLLVEKPLAPLQKDKKQPNKVKMDKSLENQAFARLFAEQFDDPNFQQQIAQNTEKLFGDLAP